MANVLIRCDQFNITPQGIIHKPTDAAFTPQPGNPHCGTTRLGQLGNHGEDYNREEVERIMRELWTQYVAANPELFKAS
jgi:hypothetical protein